MATRNFKAHYLSILAGTPDSFPPHLWDRLLPQTKITLNLLRQSNATPNVLAYAHLSGPFDYNKMQLALMGCEVQVHEMTDKCGTWSYHSLDGWYLSTSPKHYHVHNCYIKSTSTERLTNTMQFQHKSITNPTISPQDKIMLALANYKTALAGMMSGGPTQQMEELQTIVTNAHTHLQQQQESILQRIPRVETHQVPRVDTPIPQQPATRATATPTA